ncbi:MAG: hypothetical protein PCFJNLEI_01401 [Verrucomicrobiae bacterium]|nr:hypothetical protein [Verrucomicrobiae bacterium]
MKTKAKVVLVGASTRFVAAETEDGSITVFELLDCNKVKLGDVLIGYWTEFDRQAIYNQSRNVYLAVFVHDYCCQLDDVKDQYFNSQPKDSGACTFI